MRLKLIRPYPIPYRYTYESSVAASNCSRGNFGLSGRIAAGLNLPFQGFGSRFRSLDQFCGIECLAAYCCRAAFEPEQIKNELLNRRRSVQRPPANRAASLSAFSMPAKKSNRGIQHFFSNSGKLKAGARRRVRSIASKSSRSSIAQASNEI